MIPMNSVALITGASSGIGLAFAQVMAQQGHDLVLTARNQQKLDEIKIYLEEHYNVKVYVIVADLTKSEEVSKLYGQIKDQGLDIEILVNNAGIGDWGLFEDCHWPKQERMIQLNILALIHLTKLVLPEMIHRRQGKILNVASTAAFQPGPLMSVYYATKAYVLSFSQALANEVKDKGISVTCLCPGPTATNFQRKASIDDIRLTHHRKLPNPYDVAQFGYKVLEAGKTVAVYGVLNKFLVLVSKFLPRAIVVPAVRLMQEDLK